MDDITILLSTYNGEKYLEKQLESLISQRNVKLKIFVRDDGSQDRTIEILDKWKNKELLNWYSGKNLKPANSFMDLVYHAPHTSYYAFCDQDDWWIEDKLHIAVSHLKRFPSDKPALYYGRPRLVDEELNPLPNPNKTLDRMLDYRSAIINSNATGCTMVFNKALLQSVKGKTPDYIAMHDAWFHKVCIVCDGNLYFDEDVHILYRQHGNNVVGISDSKKKSINRMYNRLINKKCVQSMVVKSLLECYGNQMSKENRELSHLVVDYRKGILQKFSLLLDNRIRTNYIRRNILYKLEVLLGTF